MTTQTPTQRRLQRSCPHPQAPGAETTLFGQRVWLCNDCVTAIMHYASTVASVWVPVIG